MPRRVTVARTPRSVAAHRRAVVLLTLLLVTVVSWVLVALPALAVTAWAALPASLLLAVDLLALRSAARRRTARAVPAVRPRRAAPDAPPGEPTPPSAWLGAEPAADRRTAPGRSRDLPGRPAAPAAGRPRTVRPAARTTPRTPVTRPAAEVGLGAAAAAATRPIGAPARGWDDRRWEDETGEIVGLERPNPLAEDDRWAPVAVPPPTYTLKPVAPRPQPRPWVPERDYVLDLDAVLARRRAVNG